MSERLKDHFLRIVDKSEGNLIHFLWKSEIAHDQLYASQAIDCCKQSSVLGGIYLYFENKILFNY